MSALRCNVKRRNRWRVDGEPVVIDGWPEFLAARAAYLRAMHEAGCSYEQMLRVCNLDSAAHAERIVKATKKVRR